MKCQTFLTAKIRLQTSLLIHENNHNPMALAAHLGGEEEGHQCETDK